MHMPHEPHDHAHDDRSSWFLDQLCTIFVCAAYVGVVGAMFGAKLAGTEEQSLINIIVPWIQYMLVFGSGVLLLLTIVRAVAVWQASRQLAAHHHDHGHDHAPGDGHSHGWSPWKYIPLVIPLVLFIGLGLPDTRMIRAYERDLSDQAMPRGESMGSGGLDAMTRAQVLVGQMNGCDSGAALPTALMAATLVPGGLASEIAEEELDVPPDATPSLGELEEIAGDPGLQQSYKGYRRVEVEGNFYPGSAGGTFFKVVRLRVACCLGDARPAIMMCVGRKPQPFESGEWVAAQGRLDFVAAEGKWYPFMRVYKVYKKQPPAYPYLK